MSTSIMPASFTDRDFFTEPVGTMGITRIVEHGQILRSPSAQPEGTTSDVTYELGFCVQLDQTHCLLIASMDEQGGGDLCVGNDGFIFERLSDITPERAIPINRVDPEYHLKHNGAKVFLAKFPGPAGFIPLGSKLEDGRDHPGAGTGFLMSGCIAKEGKHAAAEPEAPFDFVQLAWDGSKLTVSPGVIIDELAGLTLNGNCAITNAVPQGESLLLPMGVDDCMRVFQFDWDGRGWTATKAGPPFVTSAGREGLPGEEMAFLPGEIEISLRKQGRRFLAHTRGTDPTGRLYESTNGLDFTLINAVPRHTVPQVLNQGLDGNVYLATNPGPGWLRNPLLGYSYIDGEWQEPFTLHDEKGIRGDDAGLIPFIDHGISSNVFLEGRWRHFNFFRNCDLRERTLHTFQQDMGMSEGIHGKEGPLKAKLPTSGLYLTEIEYL